jgi:hypothetical protein
MILRGDAAVHVFPLRVAALSHWYASSRDEAERSLSA